HHRLPRGGDRAAPPADGRPLIMQVAVIGAGVIGVTTAHCLRGHGFAVTVYERQDGPARETSAGNAGLIAPAYVAPWAQPGMLAKVFSYLLSADAPVRIRPRL